MKNYVIFGLTITTNFKFVSKLDTGCFNPDLKFEVVKRAPMDVIWSREIPQYSISGKRSFFLYHLEKWDVIRFTGIADYYISDNKIICHIHHYKYYPLIEIQFLGTVLSYWLEKLGIIAIHASAVKVDDKSIGFLSSNKGGKTSIAASLMKKGFPLITDDILPLDVNNNHVLSRPGYPTMRMWPDEAEYFLGHSEGLPLVHPKLSKRRVFVGSNGFGSFCDHILELQCLYIPKRYDNLKISPNIIIEQLSPLEGVLELIKHSFSPYLVESMGWQKVRIVKFAKIIKKIPIKSLNYPSGYKYLPMLCESILEDLQ